jgi:protein-L-isoaspartate(D-aspartate) O-methyltransferase
MNELHLDSHKVALGMADRTEVQFAVARREMVEQVALHTHLISDKIGKTSLSDRVMKAIKMVPRHAFVPAELQPYAYLNQPLPIGFGKTISQPFIVALMTDLLDVQPEDRILEVGTGLGYQAAILAELSKMVYSVEIIGELAREAENRLHRHGYFNVELREGNGSSGWPEQAPFDKIIVTAAPEQIPRALLGQLKTGGRMVIPIGVADTQQLVLVEKAESGAIKTEEILPVRFSPLVIAH